MCDSVSTFDANASFTRSRGVSYYSFSGDDRGAPWGWHPARLSCLPSSVGRLKPSPPGESKCHKNG